MAAETLSYLRDAVCTGRRPHADKKRSLPGGESQLKEGLFLTVGEKI